MRRFTRVLYGQIDVCLQSALHVGGQDEDHFFMAVNGGGEYILPGTALGGVIKHYLSQENLENAACYKALLGDEDSDSSVYFYDAVISHADVETRTGVRIDHRTGTADDGGLYTQYYLSSGARMQLRLQLFAEDEQEEKLEKAMLSDIVSSIAQGKIRFGARTRSGAGLLEVTDAYERSLDLTIEADLDRYLEGEEACFENLKETGKRIPVPEKPDNAQGGDLWILTADIPQGLIVRSGEASDMADAVNMSHGSDGTRYYIPGTSIKGVMRTYAEKVIHTLGIDEALLTAVFGVTPDEQEEKKASHVLTRDTEIEHPQRTLYPRIRIDRVAGGTMTGAKMCAEILSKPEKPLEIRVIVDGSLDEKIRKAANALVFLALRDLGLGLVRIGGSGSVGFGRLQGKSLSWNGKTAQFDEQNGLQPGGMEPEFEELLTALREEGNEI